MVLPPDEVEYSIPTATSIAPAPFPSSADPSFYGSEIWDTPAKTPSTENVDSGDLVSLCSETSVSGTDESDSETSDSE